MKFLNTLFLDSRLFVAIGIGVALFLTAYIVPSILGIARLYLLVLGSLVVLDLLLLYIGRDGVRAVRETPERLSNGDDNEIRIYIESRSRFSIRVRVIDELPPQFQKRDAQFDATLASFDKSIITYTLRPVKRGEYTFGAVHLYVATILSLVRRRYSFGGEKMVPVYPSYLQMRRYELIAISDRLPELGIKRVRKIGHTMEFDQIRGYVPGDDYRMLNWKATARRAELMVNQFQDERSQEIYSVIDKGRTMKMPFEGMSLLDYAINTSLVLANIALMKDDRAGLVTFGEKLGALLKAERQRSQMQKILETLYNQKTSYLESNYEALYAAIRQRITRRSLILLYTNFETVSSLERQLPYLRKIARDHLLVVVFFENTELRGLLDRPAETTEGIYLKTIGEKFAFEKRRIVKELARYGIDSILTPPAGLTVNAINKYLELKARRMI